MLYPEMPFPKGLQHGPKLFFEFSDIAGLGNVNMTYRNNDSLWSPI